MQPSPYIDQVKEISSQDRTHGERTWLQDRHREMLVTNKVVNDCNRLGRHVVSAESIGYFKRQLDESMDRDDT